MHYGGQCQLTTFRSQIDRSIITLTTTGLNYLDGILIKSSNHKAYVKI